LPWNYIRPQCPVGSAIHISDVAQQARGKRQSRSNRPVATPLPVPENGPQGSMSGEPALIGSKRKFPQIIRGELVGLVETGKTALRRQVKSVLRNVRSPSAGRATTSAAGSPR